MSIHCCLALRDESGKYYINAYVTLKSIFENTSSHTHIHIIHDKTVEPAKHYFEELCNEYGHAISFYESPELEDELVKQTELRINRSSLYRYFIHEFVDSDKVIYVDSDVIFLRDIKELFNINIDDFLVAGSQDRLNFWHKNGKCKHEYKDIVGALKYDYRLYVNAGVLLLNTKKLREMSGDTNIFLRKTEEILHKGIKIYNADQDILNAVFAEAPNSVLLLDDSFNYLLYVHGRLFEGFEKLNGKILHYAGKRKPTYSMYPAVLPFWKYYSQCFFGSDAFEKMDAILQDKNMRYMESFLNHPKRRQLAIDLLEGGFRNVFLRIFKRILPH